VIYATSERQKFALSCVEQGLALVETGTREVGMLQYQLGAIQSEMGQLLESYATFQAMLQLPTHTSEARFFHAYAARGLSTVCYRLGRFEEYQHYSQMALSECDSGGFAFLLPTLLANMGMAAAAARQFAEAEYLLGRAKTLAQADGRKMALSVAQMQLAWTALLAGKPEHAEEQAREALPLALQIRYVLPASTLLGILSSAALVAMKLGEARSLAAQGIQEYGSVREQGYRGILLINQALCYWLEGDRKQALSQLAESRRLLTGELVQHERVAADAFYALALAQEGESFEQPTTAHPYPEIDGVLKLVHACLNFLKDSGCKAEAEAALMQAQQSSLGIPAAQRWAQVAVAARLLEHTLNS
jgi:tetratricopeptide (TPR) repeat protein